MIQQFVHPAHQASRHTNAGRCLTHYFTVSFLLALHPLVIPLTSTVHATHPRNSSSCPPSSDTHHVHPQQVIADTIFLRKLTPMSTSYTHNGHLQRVTADAVPISTYPPNIHRCSHHTSPRWLCTCFVIKETQPRADANLSRVGQHVLQRAEAFCALIGRRPPTFPCIPVHTRSLPQSQSTPVRSQVQ